MKKILTLLDKAVEEMNQRYLLCFVSDPKKEKKIQVFDLESGEVMGEVWVEGPVYSAVIHEGILYLGGEEKIFKLGGDEDTPLQEEYTPEGKEWKQLFVYKGELWGLSGGTDLVGRVGKDYRKLRGHGAKHFVPNWICFRQGGAYIQYLGDGELKVAELDLESGEIGEIIYEKECRILGGYRSKFEFHEDWILTTGLGDGLIAYNTKTGEEKVLYRIGEREGGVERFEIMRRGYVEVVVGVSGWSIFGPVSSLVIQKVDRKMEEPKRGIVRKRIIKDVQTIFPLLLEGENLVKIIQSTQKSLNLK